MGSLILRRFNRREFLELATGASLSLLAIRGRMFAGSRVVIPSASTRRGPRSLITLWLQGAPASLNHGIHVRAS